MPVFSALLAGGIGILAVASGSRYVTPAAYVLGGAMALGGCTILTIGIIKQTNYAKWKRNQ